MAYIYHYFWAKSIHLFQTLFPFPHFTWVFSPRSHFSSLPRWLIEYRMLVVFARANGQAKSLRNSRSFPTPPPPPPTPIFPSILSLSLSVSIFAFTSSPPLRPLPLLAARLILCLYHVDIAERTAFQARALPFSRDTVQAFSLLLFYSKVRSVSALAYRCEKENTFRDKKK